MLELSNKEFEHGMNNLNMSQWEILLSSLDSDSKFINMIMTQ